MNFRMGPSLSLIAGLTLSACGPAAPTYTDFREAPTTPVAAGNPAGMTSIPVGGLFVATPKTPAASTAPATSGPIGRLEHFHSDHGQPTFGVQYALDPGEHAWAITFTLDSADLAQGNPVRLVAWRLFDMNRGEYLSPWTIAERNLGTVPVGGTMAFSWGLRDPRLVRAAIEARQNLVLVLSVNGDESNPAPTQHLNVGAYCLDSPDHFMNLSTGESGCAKNIVPEGKPAQPAKLPKLSKPVHVASLLERNGGQWCAGVEQLAGELAKNGARTNAANAKAEIAREKKLAATLCRDGGKYVGYAGEIADPTLRAFVDVAALKDALFKLQAIAQTAGLDGYRSAYITDSLQLERDLTLFMDAAVAELWNGGDASRKALQAADEYGPRLNEYYRNR